MPSAQRLLERAYLLIAENKIRDAVQVLDIVILDDPHNIEAWELYMQNTDSVAGLEALAERVHWNRDLTPAEKDEVLSFQDYMLNRLENEEIGFAERRRPAGSRSAVILIAMIFVLLTAVWVLALDIRRMTPYYFLMLFLIGLGYWFWRSGQPGHFGGMRSYSYGVSGARLAESEKPELFFHEPIIKVGPLPEDEDKQK